MFSLKVGDVFEFTGPIGAFTMDRAPGGEAGLISQGTAIAALRPMIYRAISTGLAHPMHLILGADRTEHLVYRSELEDCAGREKLFSFETIIAPDDAIFDALAARARRRWIEADANRARDFWLCGIGAGVFGLRDILRSAGYERRAVRYEKW
jgi:ferredoxin-NADP reductase